MGGTREILQIDGDYTIIMAAFWRAKNGDNAAIFKDIELRFGVEVAENNSQHSLQLLHISQHLV